MNFDAAETAETTDSHCSAIADTSLAVVTGTFGEKLATVGVDWSSVALAASKSEIAGSSFVGCTEGSVAVVAPTAVAAGRFGIDAVAFVA